MLHFVVSKHDSLGVEGQLYQSTITLPALRKILTSVSSKGDNSFDENTISWYEIVCLFVDGIFPKILHPT